MFLCLVSDALSFAFTAWLSNWLRMWNVQIYSPINFLLIKRQCQTIHKSKRLRLRRFICYKNNWKYFAERVNCNGTVRYAMVSTLSLMSEKCVLHNWYYLRRSSFLDWTICWATLWNCNKCNYLLFMSILFLMLNVGSSYSFTFSWWKSFTVLQCCFLDFRSCAELH